MFPVISTARHGLAVQVFFAKRKTFSHKIYGGEKKNSIFPYFSLSLSLFSFFISNILQTALSIYTTQFDLLCEFIDESYYIRRLRKVENEWRSIHQSPILHVSSAIVHFSRCKRGTFERTTTHLRFSRHFESISRFMEANSKSGRNAWTSDTIRSRRVQLEYVDGGNKDFAPYFFVEVIEFDLFIYIYTRIHSNT